MHHYARAWETGKAMLVCIGKVTCVRMQALIEARWAERITELGAEYWGAEDEQQAVYLKRQIDWMRETCAALVSLAKYQPSKNSSSRRRQYSCVFWPVDFLLALVSPAYGFKISFTK